MTQLYSPLNPVHSKDANSDAVKSELVAIRNELQLVKNEFEAVKGILTDGDQKVQLSGKMVAEGEIREILEDNNDIYVSELIDCRNATDLIVTLGMDANGGRMIMDIIWYGSDSTTSPSGWDAYLETNVLEGRGGVNPLRGFGTRRLKTKGKYFRIRITGSTAGERYARCGWLLQ